jgi:hypothetical protein
MNYSELPSIAVLAADFPLPGGASSNSLIPAADQLRNLAGITAAAGGGDVVKTIGDSLTVSFPDALGAVKGALALGAACRAEAAGGKACLRPRVGLHLGQAALLEGEIIGKAVDGACALKPLGGPGRIVASREVVQAAIDSGLFSASPLAAAAQLSLPQGLTGYLIGAAEGPGGSQASPAAASGTQAKGGSSLLEEIRKAIIEDTKTSGRRLSVAEAKEKYGWYGPEAMEVIATLAERGILVRRSGGDSPGPAPSAADAHSSYSGSQTGDIGKSIEVAIHSIVSEIERSVRSSAERSSGWAGTPGSDPSERGGDAKAYRGFDRSEVRDRVKSELKDWKQQRRFERRARRKGYPISADSSGFERYRAELQIRARKLRAGFIPSLITFGFVNAGLWYAYTTQARGFPWAPLVSIFWGAGVLDSLLGAIRSSRQSAEAEALPDLDAGMTTELKALNRERESVGKHFINSLSIPAALYILSPIFWAGQTWPLIVSAILAGSFLIHLLGFASTMPGKLRKFFAKAGLPSDRKSQAEARKRRDSEPKDMGSYAGVYAEAKASAAAIASSLGTADPASLAEMKPQLDAYLDQVLLLSKTANELDAIIGEIPMKALASDKADLLAKAKGAGSVLKSEYAGSIAEIEKQEESFKALKEQREIIDLRLRSSVNQLNQLKIDLARARAADREDDASRGASAISSLRARSEELSRYIEDLRSGQLEAIVDPFAELERTYGAQKAGADPALPSPDPQKPA